MQARVEERESATGEDQMANASALRRERNEEGEEEEGGRSNGRADGGGDFDFDFDLRTRRRSTDKPVDKLRKRASLFGAQGLQRQGRINYHISRLDRLKARLAGLNAAIEQETAEYAVSAVGLQRQGMDAAERDLARQLVVLRSARDGLKPSVAFHRRQLARIARRRLQMDPS
ncbi:hypothetical protein DV738_g1989, partial [Chaetothyriales sp. CBS 135597]